MATNLHVLREACALDIPVTLRAIASEIERGDYGIVNSCVVVWDSASGLDVNYSGTGEAAPNAHLLLHAGAAKMMHAVMQGKC